MKYIIDRIKNVFMLFALVLVGIIFPIAFPIMFIIIHMALTK